MPPLWARQVTAARSLSPGTPTGPWRTRRWRRVPRPSCPRTHTQQEAAGKMHSPVLGAAMPFRAALTLRAGDPQRALTWHRGHPAFKNPSKSFNNISASYLSDLSLDLCSLPRSSNSMNKFAVCQAVSEIWIKHYKAISAMHIFELRSASPSRCPSHHSRSRNPYSSHWEALLMLAGDGRERVQTLRIIAHSITNPTWKTTACSPAYSSTG